MQAEKKRMGVLWFSMIKINQGTFFRCELTEVGIIWLQAKNSIATTHICSKTQDQMHTGSKHHFLTSCAAIKKPSVHFLDWENKLFVFISWGQFWTSPNKLRDFCSAGKIMKVRPSRKRVAEGHWTHQLLLLLLQHQDPLLWVVASSIFLWWTQLYCHCLRAEQTHVILGTFEAQPFPHSPAHPPPLHSTRPVLQHLHLLAVPPSLDHSQEVYPKTLLLLSAPEFKITKQVGGGGLIKVQLEDHQWQLIEDQFTVWEGEQTTISEL